MKSPSHPISIRSMGTPMDTSTTIIMIMAVMIITRTAMDMTTRPMHIKPPR